MKNGMCPRTGEACPRQALCDVANAPLDGAVTRIHEEATGRGRKREYAARALTHVLTDAGTTLAADFAPQADPFNAAICPSDVFDRPLPDGVTAEQVAQGIGTIVGNCVTDLIADMNTEHANHIRRGQLNT